MDEREQASSPKHRCGTGCHWDLYEARWSCEAPRLQRREAEPARGDLDLAASAAE